MSWARHWPAPVYDSVVAYDRIAELPRLPAVLVDIAGSQGIRATVERHLGERIADTVVAGATHRDAFDRSFLFVPERMQMRAKEIGWPELSRR